MRDHEFMQLALQLAKQTEGQTTPNPMVGAVVVNNGRIVGMGAHLKQGEGHAEVIALKMAGDQAKNSTIYVTLEPCSHFGKTPPCADLIIKSGIKRVVVATLDPNPKVSGKGIEKLKSAGLTVDVGIAEKEAIELNAVFFHYILTGMPFVTLKAATTLDGKLATVTGESQWITGEEAREDAHYYRHSHDSILVGIGTVLADNPSLTTRLKGGGINPLRIILDRNLRTPLSSKLINDKQSQTWIFTNKAVKKSDIQKFEMRGVEVFNIGTDLKTVLKALAEKGVTSILVEGGAEVHGEFIKHHLVQQVVSYISPKLFGGATAPTFSGGAGIESLSDTVLLQIKTVEKLGTDIKLVAEVLEG
ncbi:5-amino-6-(5-phosphoribosylamino)uracil reductase [Bacillus sp. TS-2]|nr:5-amino-6-(5-phosphoribosylamino)uracil reductase [Bacillus sp. TS-2]